MLRRLGLNRIGALEPAEPVWRYERDKPGELIHIDVKKLGRFARTGPPRSRRPNQPSSRGIGWEYLHLAIDDYSRLTYLPEIFPRVVASCSMPCNSSAAMALLSEPRSRARWRPSCGPSGGRSHPRSHDQSTCCTAPEVGPRWGTPVASYVAEHTPDARPLDRGQPRDESTEGGTQPADESLINRRL